MDSVFGMKDPQQDFIWPEDDKCAIDMRLLITMTRCIKSMQKASVQEWPRHLLRTKRLG